jgi:tetratricopeptide (TPR) repeat protein
MKIFQTTKLVLKALVFTIIAVNLYGCFNMPPPGESSYNKGVDLYDEGKYAEAIEQYKLELKLNPDNQFARYNLAVAQHDLGHDDEAEKLYREILVSEEDTNSRINLATIYMARGQENAAFDELRLAAKNNPDSPKPLSVLGEYQERKSMFSEAEKNYNAAIRIDGQHAFSHFRLGRLNLSQGKTDEAITSINTAISLDPEIVEFYETQSKAYIKNGSNSQAINMLEQASTLEPENIGYYVQLGDLYKEEGDNQNAVKNYWEAIDVCKSQQSCQDDPAVHKRLEETLVLLTKEAQEKANQGRSVAKSSSQP